MTLEPDPPERWIPAGLAYQPGSWGRPAEARVVGDRLEWRLPTAAELASDRFWAGRGRGSGPLAPFLSLLRPGPRPPTGATADELEAHQAAAIAARATEVESFARAWGVFGHHCDGDYRPGTRGYDELPRWLSTMRAHHELLALAAALRAGRVSTAEERQRRAGGLRHFFPSAETARPLERYWEHLFWHWVTVGFDREARWRLPGSAELRMRAVGSTPRRFEQRLVGLLASQALEAAHVHPVVRLGPGGAPVLALEPHSLASALAIDLARAVTGAEAPLPCTGCGRWMAAPARRSDDRATYCAACRRSGAPQRAASRRYRKRVREGRPPVRQESAKSAANGAKLRKPRRSATRKRARRAPKPR